MEEVSGQGVTLIELPNEWILTCHLRSYRLLVFKDFPQKFAAVIMEAISVDEPDPGFLEEVKDITNENGSILVKGNEIFHVIKMMIKFQQE